MDTHEIQCEKVSIMRLVNQLGGDAKKYVKKLKKQNGKRATTEVYSPPRVTAWAKRMPGFSIVPGLALDLTTVDENGVAWDFDRPERREARIAREKQMFLIGSPMCTALSAWRWYNESITGP